MHPPCSDPVFKTAMRVRAHGALQGKAAGTAEEEEDLLASDLQRGGRQRQQDELN